jgi:predicted metal-dependent phosphoesterase TrpH
MRSVTHVHTRHSWDGSIQPSALVDWLDVANIKFAVVSDHDTFAGSVDCRRLVRDRALDIRIPLAAEIRTERGDVIVIFDDDDGGLPEIASLKHWAELVATVRARGGLIWLPHPFQSHQYVEELAVEADVVEIFNARCSDEQNRNAALLCARSGAVPAYGADAHRPSELGKVLVLYEDRGSSTATLETEPQPLVHQRTRASDIMAAEVTNGLSKRRPSLVAWFALRWLQHRKRELLAGTKL